MKEMLQDPLDTLPLELIRKNDGSTVTVTKDIPAEEYDTLWNMVETGFRELNQKSYEKQDMTRDEFEADINSQHVLKYVARDSSGDLLGLLTVHVGLEDVTWTNTDRLNDVQKGVDSDATSYYIGTLVVPKGLRGTSIARSMLNGALIHFQDVNNATSQNSLLFFDCAEANYPWLGKFVERLGRPSEDHPGLRAQVQELYTDSWIDNGSAIEYIHNTTGDMNASVVDRQHFYAVSVNPILM